MGSVEKSWDEYRLINGIKEYILHFPCIGGGEAEGNSSLRSEGADVILIVGDSGCDTAFGYMWAPVLRRAFHGVIYDMRGTGRSEGAGAMEEREDYYSLVYQDLAETVAYVRECYGKERILLCGHGFASALTAHYASQHPEHILFYIGAGQCTCPADYEKARCQAMELVFNMKGRVKNVLFMSRVHSESGGTYQMKLLPFQTKWRLLMLQRGIGMSDADVRRRMRIAAGKSPQYQDKQGKKAVRRARRVRERLINCQEIASFHLEDYPFPKDMRGVLISGRHDFVHPYVLVKEYWNELYHSEEEQPNIALELVEGGNANLLYEKPVEFLALVWKYYMALQCNS